MPAEAVARGNHTIIDDQVELHSCNGSLQHKYRVNLWYNEVLKRQRAVDIMLIGP